jgi:beta-xylosidase
MRPRIIAWLCLAPLILRGATSQKPLRGALAVHDPSTIVKCAGQYWLFATGMGIRSLHSKDLVAWEAGPRVFTNPPAWTTNAVPRNRGLLANWGQCCLGTKSTYNIRVGRSKMVTGPFVDRDGVDMLSGGGSLLLGTEGFRIGPGHAGILKEGQEWLSYHYYDGRNEGASTLALRRLRWDAQGWPCLLTP